MSEHFKEPFVPVFKWEFTPKHLKQFGAAHPAYMFLKGLCNFKVHPLRSEVSVDEIAAKMAMVPRTVQRRLSRLRKYNYIWTKQTRRGLAFEIILKDDKYVAPKAPRDDRTVTPQRRNRKRKHRKRKGVRG